MKVIYIDKFNHFFSSGNYITAAINACGHEVIKVPLETQADKIKAIITKQNPDFVLFGKGEDYFSFLIPWLRGRKITTIHWSFDRLFYLDREEIIIRRRNIHLADLVCTTDGGCNRQWKQKFGVNHITLRQGIHAADKIWCDPEPLECEVIFVGSVYNDYRRQLVSFLTDQYGSKFKVFGGSERPCDQIRGLGLNKLVRSVKIVVGDSLPGDHYWSNRLYEIRGRGGFLLHPETVGMENEFDIGKELVVFPRHDMPRLKQIIDYYMEHDTEREAIRLCGFNNCPTYDDRVARLLSYIYDLPERRA